MPAEKNPNPLETLLNGTDQVSIVRSNADDLGLTEKVYRDLTFPDATDDADAEEVTPPKPMKKNDRIRFSCPECALNAWAKPSAKLACGTCGLIMNPSQ